MGNESEFSISFWVEKISSSSFISFVDVDSFSRFLELQKWNQKAVSFQRDASRKSMQEHVQKEEQEKEEREGKLKVEYVER